MTAMDSFVIIYAQCFYIVLNVLINSNRLGASNDHNVKDIALFLSKRTIGENNMRLMST